MCRKDNDVTEVCANIGAIWFVWCIIFLGGGGCTLPFMSDVDPCVKGELWKQKQTLEPVGEMDCDRA